MSLITDPYPVEVQPGLWMSSALVGRSFAQEYESRRVQAMDARQGSIIQQGDQSPTPPKTPDEVLDHHLSMLRQIATNAVSDVAMVKQQLVFREQDRDAAVQRLKDFEADLALRAAGR